MIEFGSCIYKYVNENPCSAAVMPLLWIELSILLHTPQQRLPMLFNGPDNPANLHCVNAEYDDACLKKKVHRPGDCRLRLHALIL